jgi:hypothetical protein
VFGDDRHLGVEDISGMIARKWAAMRLVDGLDDEAGAPQLEDIVAPAWSRRFDRSAASTPGTYQIAKGPGIASHDPYGLTIGLDASGDMIFRHAAPPRPERWHTRRALGRGSRNRVEMSAAAYSDVEISERVG